MELRFRKGRSRQNRGVSCSFSLAKHLQQPRRTLQTRYKKPASYLNRTEMAAGEMTSTAPAVDFETALQNIRRLSNSGLAHQKKPAQLLIALEDTLKSSLPDVNGPPFSGTAYFASLVQCLEKACTPKSKDATDYSEGGLIPATLYLMATVVPETPKQVVSNQLNTLLPILIPLFDPCLSHPPALRSLVQIFTTIFLLAPVSLLNSSPLLKRAWNHFLELNVDPRPKVRHLAQEGVRKVLTTPIPPKVVAGDHPYLHRARDWAMGILEEETKGGQSKVKKVKFAGGMVMAGAEDAEGKRAIWVVQGLRGWVSVMDEEVRLPIKIRRSRNSYTHAQLCYAS
jgi:ribosomal RNA-processing protein 12